jgi:hypothetical protein
LICALLDLRWPLMTSDVTPRLRERPLQIFVAQAAFLHQKLYEFVSCGAASGI